MIWYESFYGNWNDKNGVVQVGGSFDRKKIFERAQKVADDTGETVTISAENGMKLWFYEIEPKKGK